LHTVGNKEPQTADIANSTHETGNSSEAKNTFNLSIHNASDFISERQKTNRMTASETKRHQSENVIAIAVSMSVGIIFIAFVLIYNRNTLPICRKNISVCSCLVCGGESPTGVELDVTSNEEDRTMLGDEITCYEGDRLPGSQAD
jgi:hypothetical protein